MSTTHNVSTLFPAFMLVGALAIAGCSEEPGAVWEPDSDSSSILHELGLPTDFEVAPSAQDGSGSFAVAVGAGASGEGAEVELSIESGSFTLWAVRGETLVLQALDIRLADVEVPSDVFTPDGAALTNLSAHLAAPVTLEVDDADGRVGTVAELDLEAEWTLELPGGASYEMSALRLRELPFALDIERDEAGELAVRLVAFRQGTFWRWADRFRLSDLVVDLVSGE